LLDRMLGCAFYEKKKSSGLRHRWLHEVGMEKGLGDVPLTPWLVFVRFSCIKLRVRSTRSCRRCVGTAR
jgi:hypothetical protein